MLNLKLNCFCFSVYGAGQKKIILFCCNVRILLLQRLDKTLHLIMARNETTTKWFGMKLTPEQKEKIKRLAEQRGTNQKEAVIQLVEEAVREEPLEPTPGSFYELNQDDCGFFEGPRDLSSNPEKYMKGFGK